jgi:hypothetical protein
MDAHEEAEHIDVHKHNNKEEKKCDEEFKQNKDWLEKYSKKN